MTFTRRSIVCLSVLAVTVFCGCNGMMSGDGMMEHGSANHSMKHVLVSPEQIKFTAGPEGLPPGATMAVLDGDPGKSGMYTLRAQLPSGYTVPPHWHTYAENVTVISGMLVVGAGDTIDRSSATRLGPGGFAMLPGKMHHYAYSEGPTTIQVHGMGPFDIHYINPNDDPRKQTSSSGK